MHVNTGLRTTYTNLDSRTFSLAFNNACSLSLLATATASNWASSVWNNMKHRQLEISKITPRENKSRLVSNFCYIIYVKETVDDSVTIKKF